MNALQKLCSGGFGAFEISSLALKYHFSSELLTAFLEKHGVDGNVQLPALRWQDLSTTEKCVLLATEHEGDHFNQVISTPIGVLLWRCYQVIERDVVWFPTVFRELGIEIKPTAESLLDWYARHGRSALFAAANQSRDYRNKGKAQYVDEELVRPLQQLLTFLDISFGSSVQRQNCGLSVGGFVALCNDAFEYLAKRCDVKWDAQWTTRLPIDSPLFAETRAFNVREIIEALGRLRERRVMEKTGASRLEIDEWERINLYGDYEAAYRYSMQRVPDASGARGLLRWSLIGATDLLAVDYEAKTLLVEDHFPWFRAEALFYSSDERRMDLIERGVNALKRASSFERLWGPGSRWEGVESNSSSSTPLLMRRLNARLVHVGTVFQQGLGLSRDASLELVEKGGAPNIGADFARLSIVAIYTNEIHHVDVQGSSIMDAIISMFDGYLAAVCFGIVRGTFVPAPEEVRDQLCSHLQSFVSNNKSSRAEEYFEQAVNSIGRLFSQEGIQAFVPLDVRDILWRQHRR